MIVNKLPDDTEMSRVEIILKETMEEREDIAGRILSSDELTDYIAWLTERYSQEHPNHPVRLPAFNNRTDIAALSEELSKKMDIRSAKSRLSEKLTVQNDDDFLLTGQEIAISRMPRYYPAHWHTNTYFQLCYAPAGECPIYFQNETVLLKNGAVLIIAPSVMHATPCYADDAVLKLVLLRSSTFQNVFWNQLGDNNLLSKFFRIALTSQSPASYLHFETDGDPEIRHIVFRIEEEYQTEKPYGRQMINTLVRLFFLKLMRQYEGTARLPRTEHFFWKHEYSGILSYIQSHYQHATLETVANQFNYSPKQVGRIVKNCTGESFGNLVRDLKMKKSAELLADNKYSPEQVADIVGFSTVNSFYRSFKDYYGIPPVEWAEREFEKRHLSDKPDASF